MAPLVVDLSHHNSVDLDDMKRQGVMAIIHKATQSTNFVDPKYKERRQKALDIGLGFSSYHFLVKGNPKSQMEYFIKTVNPRPGERVCIDHEPNGSNGTSPSLTDLVSAVEYLQANYPELEITIYSGHLIKEQLGSNTNATLAKTSLWIAQYNNTGPTWPKQVWPNWSLWQYTDREMINGKGPYDGNKWNGSPENLMKWFGPSEVVPVPASEVIVSVQTPPGVGVQIVVNGQIITVPSIAGA